LWRLARQNLGIDPPKCRERYMVKWDGVPIAVTYDASGENAFAVRLDFDQRKDAEEFGKHFNERATDRQLACQPTARIAL
jgi:hypothetical protein